MVEDTNDEKFASGKSPEYNTFMKKRALNEILGDLFDVAQAYEEHYAKYGSDKDPVDFSLEHTWHPASAPPRQLARVAAWNPATSARSKRICLPIHKNGHVSDTEEDTDIEQTLSARPMRNTTRDGTFAPAAPNYAPLSPEIPDTKPQAPVPPAMTAMPSPMEYQVQPAPSLSPNHWGTHHSQTAVPVLYPLCPAETMAFNFQAQPFPFNTEDPAFMSTSLGSTMSFDDEEQKHAAAGHHGLPCCLHH